MPTFRIAGGPTHCCGVIQLRTGDTATSANMAANTMAKLAQALDFGDSGFAVDDVAIAALQQGDALAGFERIVQQRRIDTAN